VTIYPEKDVNLLQVVSDDNYPAPPQTSSNPNIPFGATGTFTSANDKRITVTNGVITSIETIV